MLQRILFALTLVLLPPMAAAQSDGVIDTQEEYAAAAEGQRLYNSGDWAAAAAWLGPFADLAEGFFGPVHPETLHYRSLQVFALERLQRWEEVLAVAERAVTAAEAAGPASREALPIMLELKGSYGRGLFASGQNERALAMADAVVVQAQSLYRPDAPVIVVHRLDRARAARVIGGTANLERAVEDFAFVARVTGATSDPGANAYAVNALREGAEVLRRLGRPRDAADQLAVAIPMLERLYGPDAQETLTAMLAQVDAQIELRPADTSDLTPETLIQYNNTFELATEVSRRADRAFGQGSPIAAESMAQRGWLLLLYNGGIMGAQGVQLGVSLVDLGLQLMERGLPADDPRLVTWRMAWLAILGRIDQPSPDMALRGIAVARAAVRQRAAGLAAVSMALQAAQRAGALTPEQAAEEALFAVQELQFGMAPAVMGYWQRRLEQETGPAHGLHRAFTDTTLKGRALEKDLLALLSQPLVARDAGAHAATEAALAANRAESDRLADALAALDPTFGANFAGATLSLADLRALIGPDEAVVVTALPDMRVSDAAGIVLAVSDDAIAWAPLDLPLGDYLQSVAAIREAVQLQLGVRAAVSMTQDDAAEPRRVTFDAGAANRLYAETLGKVDAV
ncbi:MAG TPA: hypothetical protein VLA78_02550, partial [Paracoccaceae bacterium]|nr:hypothetical protein [Paracoccaceae bacterium]